MPSKKPRINLTVDNDLYEVLDELSKLTKTPKSSIVGDMLKDAQPHLSEIVKALKMVEDKKSAVPVMSKLTALANQQVASVNIELANLISENNDD